MRERNVPRKLLLPSAVIYFDDLEAVVQTLKEAGCEVSILDEASQYDSLEDLKNNSGDRLENLEIRGRKHDGPIDDDQLLITLKFGPRFADKGSGGTNLSTSGNAIGDAPFGRIHRVVMKRYRWLAPKAMVLSIALLIAGGCLVLLNSRTSPQGLYVAPIWTFMPFVPFVFFLWWAHGAYSVRLTRAREAVPFYRSPDFQGRLVIAIISAIFGAVLGYVLSR